MLTVYIVCAVLGLGLALIAAIVGDHSHETDAHFEIGHHELDHMNGDQALWLPFLSLRFWTYAFAGFGLTGLLLSIFTGTPVATVFSLALAMGLAAGLMIAFIVRAARKGESDSSTHTKEMLGLEAEVLVAIRPGQLGKVRFSAKGELIDMIAVSEDSQPIAAGTRALVVGVEGDKARVIALDALETPLLRSENL